MEFLRDYAGIWRVRIRQIEREDAEIAIEFLRDWGFTARIVDSTPQGEGPMAPLKRAA